MIKQITLTFLLATLVIFACSDEDDAINNTNVIEEEDDDTQDEIAATGVSLSHSSISLQPGETFQLSAAVAPADATNKQVTWSSSNEEVVTMLQTGLATAVQEGEATITATTTDGGHQADVSITVTAEPLNENEILFDNSVWNLLNPDVYTIVSNADARLQIDLASNAVWYNRNESGLIYKSITGDFTISAHVSSVRRTNNDVPVSCFECLGGIMARDPASTRNDQNYVLLVTGITPGGPGAEIKTTDSSSSQYQPTDNNEPPFTDGYTAHNLRIVRSGDDFSMWKRSDEDSDWVFLSTYNRPDLPETLQVGLIIYTATSPSSAVADLSVIFNEVMITQ